MCDNVSQTNIIYIPVHLEIKIQKTRYCLRKYNDYFWNDLIRYFHYNVAFRQSSFSGCNLANTKFFKSFGEDILNLERCNFTFLEKMFT